jgi:Apea-like HEPN
MVSDSELFDVMSRWTQTATNHLRSIISDVSIVGHGGQVWVYDLDNRIVFGHRNAYFKPWMIENLLYENEEWKALDEMSRNHNRMSSHCDVPVGTPYYGSSQRSAKDFCYDLLPRPFIGEQGVSLEDVEGTAQRITDLIGEFNADHITMKSVWPVCGMRVRQPIHVDDEQCFRSLTEKEKISALNFKMIEVDEGQTVIDPSLTDWYGFVLNERFQKRFGHCDMPEDFMERYNRRDKCLEGFLSVAPVVGEFVAYHGGGYTHAPRFSSFGLLSRGETGYSAGHGGSRFLIPDLSPMLTDVQSTRFLSVWKLVCHTGPSNNSSAKALRNAIRRLFYAETRAFPEDRLIDLMIAAESIYTMESQAELSFRLSQNAALWHDGTNTERLAAFKVVKEAYNLRSKIVHGSTVDGTKVALAASSVRSLLKSGIAKAIDAHLSGKFPPKWEELAFPVRE